MENDLCRLERDGPIARLIWSRPDRLNPVGRDGDGARMQAVCDEIDADAGLRCVIVTGEGRAFSAGGDLVAMRDRTGTFAGSAAELQAGYERNLQGVIRALWSLETPAIAAVNGPAVGLGFTLACLCDIRILSSEARFKMPFLNLGVIPGDGGLWLLSRMVGFSRATEMCFTGATYDAETAVSWGLASRVVAPEALMETATELAHEIAAKPPQALRHTKRLMRHALTQDYAQAMREAAAVQAILHQGADHMEGVRATLEKRVPRFTGE